jgi:hypothetical protein
MTARDPKPGQRRSLLLSLATGALLVPLAAYGASSLANAPSGSEPALTPTTAVPLAGSTDTTAPAEPAVIGIACGEEGMQLVAAEANRSISTVQQAALDALRDVCADEGRPLPGPPTLAPAATPTTVAAQPTTVGTSADDDDDEWDDDHSGHGRHGDDDDDRDDDGEDDD